MLGTLKSATIMSSRGWSRPRLLHLRSRSNLFWDRLLEEISEMGVIDFDERPDDHLDERTYELIAQRETFPSG